MRSDPKGKQIHPQYTQEKFEGQRRFTQTTPKERNHMFELRRGGLSVRAIADQLSRSTRTIYAVLTERGMQPLPDPDEELLESELEEREENGGHKIARRRRFRGGNSTKEETGESASLWRSLNPKLEQMAQVLLETNEDFALHVLASHLGIKMPVVTVDDMIQGDIRRDPELRNRLAEDKVNRLIRRGRTEMEIAEEYFGLATKLAEWKETGRWTEVVEKAVTSGELRKMVEAIMGAVSKNRQPLSEEIPPPNSTKQRNTPPTFPNLEIETAGLKAGTTVASASEKPPYSLDDSAIGPEESVRLNRNQLKMKRPDSCDLSPEEKERRLRTIRQPISVTRNQANDSIPVPKFAPETPNRDSIEK